MGQGPCALTTSWEDPRASGELKVPENALNHILPFFRIFLLLFSKNVAPGYAVQ